MTLLVKDIIEIDRLASVMATARVIRYRAEKGLISTLTVEEAKARSLKATADLVRYLESVREPDEVPHPDNADSMAYWQGLVEGAERVS